MDALRVALVLVGAATLACSQESDAQSLDPIDPIVAKQCALWAVVKGSDAVESDDADEVLMFQGLTQYFVGLYEGMTGRGIDATSDEAALRQVEDDIPRFDRLCGALMRPFGERLTGWGDTLGWLGERSAGRR